MTPLIQEMVSLSPEESLDFHWFDMTAVYRPVQNINAEILSRSLPFPRTALVCQYENKKVMVLVRHFPGYTGVSAMQKKGGLICSLLPFTYDVKDGDVRVGHVDKTKFDYRSSPAVGVIAFISLFLDTLDTQSAIGYMPVKRSNWDKKIRQAKLPRYDWKTIVVEPPKPKGEDKGGTHASPRWHERRGHWRTTKSQQRIWVKNCEVGDRKLGAVFHDYKLEANA